MSEKKKQHKLLRIAVRSISYTFLGLIVLYIIGRPTQLWLDTLYTGDREPYLQMPAPTSITIRWQSKKAEIGVLQYGIRQDSLDQKIVEQKSTEEHELRVTGLIPGTKYFYSVGNNSSQKYAGANYWFETPKPAGDSSPVRFAVLGDPGYLGDAQKNVRDALLDWLRSNPRQNQPAYLDLLLTTGDNAYRSGTYKQFANNFFKPYATILRNIPVWPIYGNHDARRATFFNVFSLPTAAESGGIPSGTEHYYAFDYHNVHFVVLDTEDSDLSVDSDMLTWLKKDLTANRQPWLITLFHHPPYAKGSHDSDDRYDSRGRLFKVRENILPILEQGGVDLVLSGHSHMYERSHLLDCHYGTSGQQTLSHLQKPENRSSVSIYNKPSGKTPHAGAIYTVIGSSSKLSGPQGQHTAMAQTIKSNGSLVIDVNPEKLEGRFISDQGKILDTFAINKKNSLQASPFPDCTPN